MPEENSNTPTHPTQEQLALEVLEAAREQLLDIGPDYEVHLASDLGRIKMFYQLTIEEHQAESKALRLLDDPPPGQDEDLLAKMAAAVERSDVNQQMAWDRYELAFFNSSPEDPEDPPLLKAV